MLRRVAAWAAAVLVGLLVGAASAWAALEIGRSSFGEEYGAWRHSRATGSVAAGPYTRAIIARDGLLALSAREALYFTLSEDDQGDPLNENCVYELAGRAPNARWWSVTLYAEDSFLAQNEDHAASIDASSISLTGDGRWRARIATIRGDAVYWLSSRNARRDFSLTLRIYNPHRDYRPSAETLPTLTRLSCLGEA
ncbi:MAG: DUF1214 domain-containing protein [Hyphomonadaceae bacterium]|nr:DUF1214 domain-containing protein [Hyphomonadaceae bacterium]